MYKVLKLSRYQGILLFLSLFSIGNKRKNSYLDKFSYQGNQGIKCLKTS